MCKCELTGQRASCTISFRYLTLKWHSWVVSVTRIKPTKGGVRLCSVQLLQPLHCSALGTGSACQSFPLSIKAEAAIQWHEGSAVVLEAEQEVCIWWPLEHVCDWASESNTDFYTELHGATSFLEELIENIAIAVCHIRSLSLSSSSSSVADQQFPQWFLVKKRKAGFCFTHISTLLVLI